MASIRKRGDSYLIVVSMGYDYAGNRRKAQQKTVHPPENLTPKQREKWLKEQVPLFEIECKNTPRTMDKSITPEQYSGLNQRRDEHPAVEFLLLAYNDAICRFSIRFQLTKPYRSLTRNMTKYIRSSPCCIKEETIMDRFSLNDFRNDPQLTVYPRIQSLHSCLCAQTGAPCPSRTDTSILTEGFHGSYGPLCPSQVPAEDAPAPPAHLPSSGIFPDGSPRRYRTIVLCGHPGRSPDGIPVHCESPRRYSR